MTPPLATVVVVAALVVSLAALVAAVLAVRDARRARLAVEEIALADRPPLDDVDWQLEWIEPGVYFLANTSPASPALQVEVSSALTPVAGGPATTATVHAQRVNPGAWIEVRHPAISQDVFDDLEQLRRSAAVLDELRRRPSPLDTTELATLAEADETVYELHDRVEYTLAYSVSWRTSAGASRRKSPLEQRLVPSPSAV
ncbi:hypothetical protein GCM10022197_39480 [Microlunatus spumicola]|uniref:DUF4230 domain-containing protein n=1 Tax=Microlunatus spumicola TaxID=81499 RepID=A0ABP6Y6K6_9ACTN